MERKKTRAGLKPRVCVHGIYVFYTQQVPIQHRAVSRTDSVCHYGEEAGTLGCGLNCAERGCSTLWGQHYCKNSLKEPWTWSRSAIGSSLRSVDKDFCCLDKPLHSEAFSYDEEETQFLQQP